MKGVFLTGKDFTDPIHRVTHAIQVANYPLLSFILLLQCKKKVNPLVENVSGRKMKEVFLA